MTQHEAGRDHGTSEGPASIPGDPFPWEPDPRIELDATRTQPGATPSPADSGDPTSFDLGGGD